MGIFLMVRLTWMTTRGDWEKYQRGRPNRLIRAVFVSYVSEQRVLRMLPPEHAERLRGKNNEPGNEVQISQELFA